MYIPSNGTYILPKFVAKRFKTIFYRRSNSKLVRSARDQPLHQGTNLGPGRIFFLILSRSVSYWARAIFKELLAVFFDSLWAIGLGYRAQPDHAQLARFGACFKMEDDTAPPRKKPRFPLSFEGKIGEEEKVMAVKERFQKAKQTLKLQRNLDMLTGLLDMLEGQQHEQPQPSSQTSSPQTPIRSTSVTSTPSSSTAMPTPFSTPTSSRVQSPQFSPSSSTSSPAPGPAGFDRRSYQIHTPFDKADVHNDGVSFVTTDNSLKILVRELNKSSGKCPLCSMELMFDTFKVDNKDSHAGRISMQCVWGHEIVWFSSPRISGKFLVDLR